MLLLLPGVTMATENEIVSSAYLKLDNLSTTFIFNPSESQELLRIEASGRVFFQGRELGTDPEIYEGLRRALSGYKCPAGPEKLP